MAVLIPMRTKRTLLAAGAAAGAMLLLTLWLDTARLLVLGHLVQRSADALHNRAEYFTAEAGRCAADINELHSDIAAVTEELRQQEKLDSSGLQALQDRERECAQQTADLKDALREKEARLQYLKGRLNAQQSELEAMARLLAYLRGVHIADVPERGNDEDLRNALIASLMGDSEDEQALSDLQALTNGQLLDKARAQGQEHLRDEM